MVSGPIRAPSPIPSWSASQRLIRISSSFIPVGTGPSAASDVGAGDTAVIIDERQVRGQAVTRCRWLQHELRALLDHTVGRTEHAGAERLDQEFQNDRDKPVRQIRQDFREAVFDGAEAARHAPLERGKIGLLAALVLPAFQRGRQQIQFGKDIAEPGRQHFLAF